MGGCIAWWPVCNGIGLVGYAAALASIGPAALRCWQSPIPHPMWLSTAGTPRDAKTRQHRSRWLHERALGKSFVKGEPDGSLVLRLLRSCG